MSKLIVSLWFIVLMISTVWDVVNIPVEGWYLYIGYCLFLLVITDD